MPPKSTAKPALTVDAYLAALAHPLKAEVVALRKLILAIDPSVSEEVKWNAPSFRTTEHFATMNLRSPQCVQLILHLGAKKRAASALKIDDPTGLLEWLGADRASVKFASKRELSDKHAALERVLRQWIECV
jgi:hypothetical protein